MEPLVKLTVPLPDILEEVGGEYRVKGHRITLYHIVTAHNERWIGPHAMVFHFPTLSLYEIEKVLEFYRANQEAVLDFVRQYRAVLDRQMAELPKGPSKATLLARLEAQKKEATSPA